MTSAEILPDLSSFDLVVLADWLKTLPLHVIPTLDVSKHSVQLSCFLILLADLRRKG